MIRLTINNEEHQAEDGLSVRELLEQLDLTGQYVAVERNREIVPYQTFAATTLQDGDVLEIVTLVGGG